MNCYQADYLESLKEIERLKAENEALRAEIDDIKQVQFPKRVKNVTESLRAQRDALLEALSQIAEMDRIDAALDPQWAVRVARAAIAKAEGV